MVTYYGSSYHLSLKGTESLFPLLSFLPRSSHSSLSLSSPVLFEPFSLAPSGVVNVLVGPRFAGQAVKQKPKNSRIFFQKPYFFLFAEVLFRVWSFFACESIKPFFAIYQASFMVCPSVGATSHNYTFEIHKGHFIKTTTSLIEGQKTAPEKCSKNPHNSQKIGFN